MDDSEPRGKYPDNAAVSTAGEDETVRSAGVVGAATLASRVLGLVRDQVVANLFPFGATDAFYIAFMIPNLFRRLVGEGALAVSFVPVFTGWLRRSREEARLVFNATWTLAALVSLAITLLGLLFADELVRVFAPGFALEPGKQELAVQLLRLCFPYILLLTLVAIAMGALNVLGHFFTPAIAPVLLNVCLIGGALIGYRVFEVPIIALGWAVLLAGALQVLIQIPPLVALGLRPAVVFAPRHPAIRRLAAIMAPATLGASVYQVNLVVSRFLASFQGEGAVSYLYYANRLIEFPLGVFVFALGMVGLARFSHLAKADDADGLSRAFASTLALTLALALPSTLGLILLREALFSQLFAWNPNVFGADAVAACGWTLLLYALGLVPIAVSRIYINLCLAHENTATGARAAFVSLGVNALASLALIGPMPEGSLPHPLLDWQRELVIADLGYAGLALASSVASLANALYVIGSAHARHGALLSRQDVLGWLRLVAATTAMSLVVSAVLQVAPFSTGRASLRGLAVLMLSVAAGGAVFLFTLRALGAAEYFALRSLVRRGATSR